MAALLNVTRKVLCLDWDKRSLRIVVARIGGGRAVLEDAHSHRLPAGLDADDPAAMGDYIQQMLRRHRLHHHRRVVVDVPRERAVINRLALPPTPMAEVAAAVRFQAMKELPFPVDSAAIDYVVMARDAAGLATEVLLAAVTLETLGRVQATCQAAGLTPTRIGLRPYANLVSVQQVHPRDDEHVLFVDVGPGATEIDVFFGDTLAFARSANVNVPVPVPEPEARESEDSRIISIADIADLAAPEEAIAAAGNELLVEVTRTLQAYRATDPDATIQQVIVAGGTGIEPQLAERLEARLGAPVKLFDPTGPLRIDAEEAPKLRSFSAALGLAWGLSREGLLALDFLNPKRPYSARETLRRRARLAGVAALGVLAVTAAGLGKWAYDLSRELARLRSANTQKWTKVQELVKVTNRNDEVREWAVQAVWPEDLLTLTQLAVDPGRKMVVREIELDTLGRKPAITLRDVHVTDYQVPAQFVEAVSAVQVDGAPVYQARQEQWNPVPAGLKLKGKLDIRIDLLKLQAFKDAQAEREKARKKRLQGL